MRSRARFFAGRVAVVVAAIAFGALAWGSGRAEVRTSPAPVPPIAATPVAGAAKEVVAPSPARYEITARLVELAKDARFDIARDPAAARIVGLHWRKSKPPFALLPGDSAARVMSIALRTSATETPPTSVQMLPKPLTADARTWNTHEGSFDQREALVSPGASTIAYTLSIPAAARLSFSEGTVNATEEETVFSVSVVDERGTVHPVHRHALPPTAARRWTDQTVDLGAFAGQTVELRLTTRIGARVPLPTKVDGAPRPKDDPLAAAGVPVALWGNPVILAKTTSGLARNVLWIVVDALRPDVIPSFHDEAEDAERRAARPAPLDAHLPKVPGLTPAIDQLAARGVRFTHAYSAATWTRPGTLAMLAGARSSELGIDPTAWLLTPRDMARFYASDPPLISLALRRRGAITQAFVNNPFLGGYTPVGLDMGFERVSDHRYRTRDTQEITREARAFVEGHKDTRFFLFVNFRSPHYPYDPPRRLASRIPPPPAGPKDPATRLYMAEAAKDDEAIGALVASLDDAGLRDDTIVVLTADHGETLSSAHAGTSVLDKAPTKNHHEAGHFEETTRVPIVVVAPGLLPEGHVVKERVRTIDLAPTMAELLGIEAHPKATGKSLVGLAKGETEEEARVVVTEGRGSNAVVHGRHRLVAAQGSAGGVAAAALFDLVDDPGERRDLAAAKPDMVAEMTARLEAALANVPVAGSAAAREAVGVGDAPVAIRLRFASGGQPRRVSGELHIGDARTTARSFEVRPIEIGSDAVKADGARIEVAFSTVPNAPVGLDVIVDPPGVPVTWELYLDDRAWPADAVFGGPSGLGAPLLRSGLTDEETRARAQAPRLPSIDPASETGLFVARAPLGKGSSPGETSERDAARARMLRAAVRERAGGGGR